MQTSTQQTLSLPPFTPAVTWLIAVNSVVFFAMVLMGMSAPEAAGHVLNWFWLQPSAVMQGKVWQIVTYGFLHTEFLHWFFNMIALWMFGPSIEGSRGSRYFMELFFAGVVGGALCTIGLSYTGVLGNPNTPTIGASAGIYAVLIAFGIFFAESDVIMIPLPVAIKAKYMVAILIVVTVVFSLQGHRGVAELAHLGGLLFGYLFVKFVPARGLRFEMSESLFLTRNLFQRWKRRRASKKFQVYMRKQNLDPKDSGDDPGKNRPAEDITKKNGGGPSGWVN